MTSQNKLKMSLISAAKGCKV